MRKLNKIITTAAMVAAILAGTAPKAAATGCPYTVGPLGRYIAPDALAGLHRKAAPPHTWHTAGTI